MKARHNPRNHDSETSHLSIMAFAALLVKAQYIKWRKYRLLREKKELVQQKEGAEPSYSCLERLEHLFVDLRHRAEICCRRWLSPRTGSCCERFLRRLRHAGTLDNFLLKSLVGFLAGFLLTYVFFMFFVLTLNFRISTATTICSVVGGVLTLGLAFSKTVRCVVLMIVPQLFTVRGRQALLAYAFILALTGPGRNTLNNMRVMSESLACGHEQLRQAVQQIVEAVKKPYRAIRDAVRHIIKVVKYVVQKIKQVRRLIYFMISLYYLNVV